MADPARGPTTEELRARVLAHEAGRAASAAVVDGAESPTGPQGHHETVGERQGRQPASLLLPRPCLACGRNTTERMCDLCQRLEVAEASAER